MHPDLTAGAAGAKEHTPSRPGRFNNSPRPPRPQTHTTRHVRGPITRPINRLGPEPKSPGGVQTRARQIRWPAGAESRWLGRCTARRRPVDRWIDGPPLSRSLVRVELPAIVTQPRFVRAGSIAPLRRRATPRRAQPRVQACRAEARTVGVVAADCLRRLLAWPVPIDRYLLLQFVRPTLPTPQTHRCACSTTSCSAPRSPWPPRPRRRPRRRPTPRPSPNPSRPTP